jgi:hypothetical protein
MAVAAQGWKGAKFGAHGKRGWLLKLGTGRMFDAWTPDALTTLLSEVRPFVAKLYGCPPEELVWHPDRVGVKPARCPALPVHLDQNRLGTFQLLVALSETTAVAYEGSHKNVYNQGGDGYYELQRREVQVEFWYALQWWFAKLLLPAFVQMEL